MLEIPSQRLFQHWIALPKTLIVGAVATLADMTLLAVMVQFFGCTPQFANIPSLLVGSIIQFFGNRYVSFEGAKDGKVHQQMLGFVLAEMGGVALNAALFHILVTSTSLTYALARPAGTFVVFICFSYPAWNAIFKGKAKSL